MMTLPFDRSCIVWCHAVLLGLSVLAGCATVTFKRGASPEAIAADERACRAANPQEAAYVECMRRHDSYVSGGTQAPEATPANTPTEAPVLDEATGAASDKPAALPSPTHSPDAAAAVPAPATAPAAEATTGKTSGTDPLAPVAVASWWKLGGGAADLDRATDACVGKLGDAHRPQPGASVVTAGLLACLREAGWYTLKGSGAR